MIRACDTLHARPLIPLLPRCVRDVRHRDLHIRAPPCFLSAFASHIPNAARHAYARHKPHSGRLAREAEVR